MIKVFWNKIKKNEQNKIKIRMIQLGHHTGALKEEIHWLLYFLQVEMILDAEFYIPTFLRKRLFRGKQKVLINKYEKSNCFVRSFCEMPDIRKKLYGVITEDSEVNCLWIIIYKLITCFVNQKKKENWHSHMKCFINFQGIWRIMHLSSW